MIKVLPVPILLSMTMLPLACSTEKKDLRTKSKEQVDQSKELKDQDSSKNLSNDKRSEQNQATDDKKNSSEEKEVGCLFEDSKYRVSLKALSEPGQVNVEISQSTSNTNLVATQLYDASYPVYSGTNDDGWVMLTAGDDYVTVDVNLALVGVKQFTVENCKL